MGEKQRNYPEWDAERAAKALGLSRSRFDIARVFRSVYANNRDVFRAWGYRTESGEDVSLGDKAEFLASTQIYDRPIEGVDGQGRRFATETGCVNADCAETAKRLIDAGYNPAILNLASRHHACGGYDSGARAQEESLCRVSTLSQSLYQYFDPALKCVRDAEVEHRYTAYPLDIEFGGIYSPNVTFFRQGPDDGFAFRREPFRCGVISVAALNFRDYSRYANSELEYRSPGGGFTPEGDKIQLNKIRTIFRIALGNGHDSVVLGAFGCGAFMLPPEDVARQFARVLQEPEFDGRFRAVVFAILERTGPSGFDPDFSKFAPFYRLFGR